MADNLETGTSISSVPPNTIVATDEIGGVHHQKVKIEFGLDGAVTRVSSTDPLPVTLANAGTLPSGAATDATLAAFEAANHTDLAALLTKLSATLAVTQSGTWTVQPGNTANTTAWKVDGSAVTQPVSGTFWQATQPVSNAGTFAVQAAQTGTWNVGTVTTVTTVSAVTAISNALPAGTNTIGAITGATSAASGGIASTSRLVSAAASTNATSVKASAGRVYSVQCYNAATTIRYLKLYNKASAPTVGTDTPIKTIPLPPSTGMILDWANIGYYFSTGIAYALTTGSADADTGALTAADIVGLGIDYV